MDSIQRLGKLENIALVVCFLAAITLPLCRQFATREEGAEKIEARKLGSLPSLQWTPSALNAFPEKFEAYFADHFGFRLALLRLGNTLKAQWLGVSASPNAVIGKSGWLYYSGENTFDSFRGAKQLTPDELERWRQVLQRRHDWSVAQGAHYVFVLVPEKQTIYPEYVPARFKRVRSQTPLQQLVEYMTAHSTVDIIDLRQSLVAAKAREQVYFKIDTHWNALGAFAAYQQIVDRLSHSFPGLRAQDRSKFEFTTKVSDAGDLARIAGLNIREERADAVPIEKKSSPPEPLTIDGIEVPEAMRPFATEVEGATNLPRAVMIHDSFSLVLMPFLSEDFARIVYLRRILLNNANFEKGVAATVQSEHPQFLIEEMAERHVVIVPDKNLLFGEPGNTRIEVPARSQPAVTASRPPVETRGPIPPHNRYSLQWAGYNIPAAMSAARASPVQISVKNTGDWTWRSRETANPSKADGSYAVRLGYRWIKDNSSVGPDTGLRGELRGDVPPGEIADFDFEIMVPAAGGNYELQLDLVEELVTWFSHKGTPTLTVRVKVQ